MPSTRFLSVEVVSVLYPPIKRHSPSPTVASEVIALFARLRNGQRIRVAEVSA